MSHSYRSIDRHKAMDIKPESIISSGYDPVKSEEETDDEDMHKATDRSSSHENHLLPINVKQEVEAEIKTEDDSTDDERSPEIVVSSSTGYNPVKSEETDNEELGEDTNTSNEQHLPIKVKPKVKTEEDDVGTDDEYSSEEKEPGNQRATANRTTKKRKTEVEESNGSVQNCS